MLHPGGGVVCPVLTLQSEEQMSSEIWTGSKLFLIAAAWSVMTNEQFTYMQMQEATVHEQFPSDISFSATGHAVSENVVKQINLSRR